MTPKPSSHNAFRALHHQAHPFMLGNVWNVESARIMDALHFKAIGTSSAAVAASLGFSDGEGMPWEDYLYVIRRIRASVPLPMSVDLEYGYGKTADDVIDNIRTLHGLGVAGINLEDSVVGSSDRKMAPLTTFCDRLTHIMAGLCRAGIDIFINLRCDTFLLNVPGAEQEAALRVHAYEACGVDGIFLPGLTDLPTIGRMASTCSLPLNVMYAPGMPSFRALREAGVKRISTGNFLHSLAYQRLEAVAGLFRKQSALG